MTRRGAIIIAVVIIVALLALLVYSLDRTSWLLAQYELSQPGTLADWLRLSPLALGVAAALVIEVGAVALVAGDVLALERSSIKRYATAGLAVVLSVQALANLLAGYLRGYASVRATLEAHGASAEAAWYVAGLSWVLSSAAVPALIFILSKLAAHVLRLALSAPQAVATTEIGTDDQALIESERVLSAPLVTRPVSGYVYFLRSQKNGYKIGCATIIERRVQQIAAFVPFAVEVVHTIASDDMYATERCLHQYFDVAGKRIKGEWFALTSVDLSAIRALAEVDIVPVIERAQRALIASGGVRNREFDSAFHLQQASVGIPAAQPPSDADDRALNAVSAPLDAERSTAQPLTDQAVIPLDRYPCPHCGRALTSGRAVGAAKTNGYCQFCKAERKVA